MCAVKLFYTQNIVSVTGSRSGPAMTPTGVIVQWSQADDPVIAGGCDFGRAAGVYWIPRFRGNDTFR
jgi:hypothetical protein